MQEAHQGGPLELVGRQRGTLRNVDQTNFLNFSEMYEQPQELQVGSNVTVVHIFNSRTFFVKKPNPQGGGYKEHSNY